MQAVSWTGPKLVKATIVLYFDFLPVTLCILAGYVGVDIESFGILRRDVLVHLCDLQYLSHIV